MRESENWIPTRESLLSRLRDWDDEESWESFFRIYGKLIYRAARKSGLNDAEAQDVVQETVITVAKKIPEFRYDRSKGTFKGWLLQTTRWRIKDQFRKRTNNTLSLDEGLQNGIPAPAHFDLDRYWELIWQEEMLESAMERIRNKVSPKEIQIFDLLLRQEWPPRKIAQKLHIDQARVYYAKYKVSRMLRNELKNLERDRSRDKYTTGQDR